MNPCAFSNGIARKATVSNKVPLRSLLRFISIQSMFFFLSGVALEGVMAKLTIGRINFYEVFKKKQVQIKAREELIKELNDEL